VAAGAVAKLVLAQKGIYVGAHIQSVHGVEDVPFSRLDKDVFQALAEKEFPVLDDEAGEKMQQEILSARERQDSVGGVIACAVTGLPAGVGAPDFDCNVEGIFSRYLFAVPAVKGIEFGDGFRLCSWYGSQANDPFRMEGEQVTTVTNHNGGINGGITNGMPILFQVAMKPTPSIAQIQETVDFRKGENTEIAIHGRHDPCIVHRAVPVVEAAAALATCTLLGI
jgi:chorismate synthase